MPATVYLVGDPGAVSTDGNDPVLKKLANELVDATENDVVAFLGDIIYHKGLPKLRSRHRKHAEAVVKSLLETVAKFPGTVVFLPGNHDAGNKPEPDFLAVKRLKSFVLHTAAEGFPELKVVFPLVHEPGPSIIPSMLLNLIAVNGLAFFSKGFVKEKRIAFSTNTRASIRDSIGKPTIILSHFPVYSHSKHGGKFMWRTHLFPLTLYNKRLKIPLPLVGSLLPAYRRYLGAPEDFAHPLYRRYRKAMKACLEGYNGIIVTAGHEHNLQIIEHTHNLHIVSGASSKHYWVKPSRGSRFAADALGYMKLTWDETASVMTVASVICAENKKGLPDYARKWRHRASDGAWVIKP